MITYIVLAVSSLTAFDMVLRFARNWLKFGSADPEIDILVEKRRDRIARTGILLEALLSDDQKVLFRIRMADEYRADATGLSLSAVEKITAMEHLIEDGFLVAEIVPQELPADQQSLEGYS